MKKESLIYIFTSVFSSAVFIVITVNVFNGNLNAWNDSVYEQIALFISPPLTNFMVFIDIAGKWYVYLSTAVLLLIIAKTRMKFGLPLTLTLAAGMALNYLLKQIFAVPRPDIYRLVSASGYGHPSGHIMYGLAFIAMCVFLVWKYTSNKPLKISSLAFAVLFMLLMGFNRIYLGVHTPTDVVAGYFAGVFVIAASVFILPKLGLLSPSKREQISHGGTYGIQE